MFKVDLHDKAFPEVINVHLKNANSNGVHHAYILAGETSMKHWQEDSPTIFKVIRGFKNKNIKNARIIDLEYRSQGGRAYQCVADITHEDETYTIQFDVRDYNLFNILQLNGCDEQMRLNGSFCFLILEGNVLYLCPEDTRFSVYNDALELQNKQRIVTNIASTVTKLARKDLKIGNIYLTKELEKVVFLGTFKEIEYKTHAAKYFNINTLSLFAPISLFGNEQYTTEDFIDVLHDLNRDKIIKQKTLNIFAVEEISMLTNGSTLTEKDLISVVQELNKTRYNSVEDIGISSRYVEDLLRNEKLYLYAKQYLTFDNPENVTLHDVFLHVYENLKGSLPQAVNDVAHNNTYGISVNYSMALLLVSASVSHFNKTNSYKLFLTNKDTQIYNVENTDSDIYKDLLNAILNLDKENKTITEVMGYKNSIDFHNGVVNFHSKENWDLAVDRIKSHTAINEQLIVEDSPNLFVMYAIKNLPSAQLRQGYNINSFYHLANRRYILANLKDVFGIILSEKYDFSYHSVHQN